MGEISVPLRADLPTHLLEVVLQLSYLLQLTHVQLNLLLVFILESYSK